MTISIRPLLLLLVLAPFAAAQTASSRGDANADAVVNTADVGYLADHLLGAGPAAVRSCLADVNADSAVTLIDVFRLIDYLAAGGAAPPAQPAEVCDGVDNDCDGQVDEGFNLTTDTNNCGSCGVVCQQVNSFNTCYLGNCNPQCDFGWTSCDGNATNGCETLLNSNPQCSSPPLIGTVSGDSGSGSSKTTASGRGEAWLRVQITEDNHNLFSTEHLIAQIKLSAPIGVGYDLYVRCGSCSGAAAGSSTLSAGTDTVEVRNDDALGGDDAFVVVIEIRFSGTSGSSCGDWALEVIGDVGTPPADTCS